MSALPTPQENPTGLHGRYLIHKADGSPCDPEAEYFVLRVDGGGSDPAHAAACRLALITYADAIARDIPDLAMDLRRRYSLSWPGTF